MRSAIPLCPGGFQRWLEQDYIFLRSRISFQSIAAAKTPRPAQKILIAGLAALDRETDWFEAGASHFHCNLNTLPHQTCQRYTDFLLASAYTKPFERLLAILFAVEAAYLIAWSALPAQGTFAEFIRHWSSPQFQNYVYELHLCVDQHKHPNNRMTSTAFCIMNGLGK